VLGIVKTFDSNRGIGIIHGQNGGDYRVILADVMRLEPLTCSFQCSLCKGPFLRRDRRSSNDAALNELSGLALRLPVEIALPPQIFRPTPPPGGRPQGYPLWHNGGASAVCRLGTRNLTDRI